MNPTDFARDPRQAAAYRILDANLNRCHEGLRVMEEYLRFVVEDVHLSTLCKQLRHDLAAVSGPLAKERLHAMRDVAGDVGTGIATLSEYQRYELKDVMTANVRRVEQSLRGWRSMPRSCHRIWLRVLSRCGTESTRWNAA